MASPFRIFRKHQKTWFAALSVMAIIAFVFLSGSPGGNSGPGLRDEVMVRTSKFGNLHRGQIQGLLSQRQQLLGFLAALESETRDMIDRRENRIESARGMIGPSTEESVVEKWVFARQAESMGIVISDKAVNDFLRDITNNRVTAEKMDGVLRQQQRSSMSENQLFAILREELLALRLRGAVQRADAQRVELLFVYDPARTALGLLQAAAPERHRSKRRPCPWSRSSRSAPDPTEAELKKFFDEHKETVARPESPDPVFRIPARSAWNT